MISNEVFTRKGIATSKSYKVKGNFFKLALYSLSLATISLEIKKKKDCKKNFCIVLRLKIKTAVVT